VTATPAILRERSYAPVLLLIVITFTATTALPESGFARLIVVLLQGATLIAAVHASGASRRGVQMAIGVVALAFPFVPQLALAVGFR
jgi:hypothetical protein